MLLIVRNIEQLSTTFAGADPERIAFVQLDVAREAQAAAAIEAALARYGRIDVLVNNAAYGLLSNFEELTPEEIEQQFGVNVFGVMHVLRAALPVETHRIGKVVDWIRRHDDQQIRIDDMAGLAHMSPSSLHEHLKSLTSMSPLQFQKTLRLQEARRLMLSTGMDAALACQRVGYASPSQFSREHTRHFGSAPTRDMARLRSAGLAQAVSFTQ